MADEYVSSVKTTTGTYELRDARLESVAAVASSGAYADLTGTPALNETHVIVQDAADNQIAKWARYSETTDDYTATLPDATTSKAGLMSAADKAKLDGVAEKANAYSLPAATVNTLGGVRVGSGLSVTSAGLLSATGGSDYTAGANVTIEGKTVSAAGELAPYGEWSGVSLPLLPGARFIPYGDEVSAEAVAAAVEQASVMPGWALTGAGKVTSLVQGATATISSLSESDTAQVTLNPEFEWSASSLCWQSALSDSSSTYYAVCLYGQMPAFPGATVLQLTQDGELADMNGLLGCALLRNGSGASLACPALVYNGAVTVEVPDTAAFTGAVSVAMCLACRESEVAAATGTGA